MTGAEISTLVVAVAGVLSGLAAWLHAQAAMRKVNATAATLASHEHTTGGTS